MSDLFKNPQYQVGCLFPYLDKISHDKQIKPIITFGMFDVAVVESGETLNEFIDMFSSSFDLYLKFHQHIPTFVFNFSDFIFDISLNLSIFPMQQHITWINHSENQINLVLVDAQTLTVKYVRKLSLDEFFFNHLRDALKMSKREDAQETYMMIETLEALYTPEEMMKTSDYKISYSPV
ncbi:MAG: hypothetical protein ACR2MS_09105 [Weeksellaceae bacterium]